MVAAVVAVVLTLLVAASRVYLGAHWASDVVSAIAFAVAWLMLTLLVAAWLH
jgi:undecaprenyl-diphosphatase